MAKLTCIHPETSNVDSGYLHYLSVLRLSHMHDVRNANVPKGDLVLSESRPRDWRWIWWTALRWVYEVHAFCGEKNSEKVTVERGGGRKLSVFTAWYAVLCQYWGLSNNFDHTPACMGKALVEIDLGVCTLLSTKRQHDLLSYLLDLPLFVESGLRERSFKSQQAHKFNTSELCYGIAQWLNNTVLSCSPQGMCVKIKGSPSHWCVWSSELFKCRFCLQN